MNCGIGSDLDFAVDAPDMQDSNEFLKTVRPLRRAVQADTDIIHYNTIRNMLLKDEIDQRGWLCMSTMKTIGVFLSLVLRHKPEAAGISLDKNGWAEVSALIDGVNKTEKYALDFHTLEKIVRTDGKQRYSFNADKTKIRANQGHSVAVDVELKEQKPPEILYHGTGKKYLDSIKAEGLKPKSRLYVHLSPDEATAVNVGRRHGVPVVLKVNAGIMYQNGYRFYLSENGVWLTGRVPVEYLDELPRSADGTGI